MIFVGMKNGFIRIYPYCGPQVFESLDEYWTRGSHDSEYGIVTHLVTSFDDRFALSGGEDGNIFGYVIKGDANVVQEQTEGIPKMPAFAVIERRTILCQKNIDHLFREKKNQRILLNPNIIRLKKINRKQNRIK